MQVAALPRGILSIKLELFMLHSLVVQCEELFLLLLSKENCLFHKKICILILYQNSKEIYIWK